MLSKEDTKKQSGSSFVKFERPMARRGWHIRHAMPITKADEYIITQCLKAGVPIAKICRFTRMHLSPYSLKPYKRGVDKDKPE